MLTQFQRRKLLGVVSHVHIFVTAQATRNNNDVQDEPITLGVLLGVSPEVGPDIKRTKSSTEKESMVAGSIPAAPPKIRNK